MNYEISFCRKNNRGRLSEFQQIFTPPVAIREKYVTKLRIFAAVLCGVIIAVSLIGGGISRETFVGIIPELIFLALIELLVTPFCNFFLKSQIKIMKKSGKLPFSSESVIEFYDDRFAETTETGRDEKNYESIERTSIVDGMIYIHINSVLAYIIPRCCLGSESEYDDFVEFLRSKCAVVESY